MADLSGKIVLVTGAAKGIGRALSLGFAKAGASVCCAVRSPEQASGILDAVRQHGGEAIALACDVRDAASVSTCFDETSSRFGGIDIVVANAGIQGDGKSVEAGDPQQWRSVIETNLLGTYHCFRAAIPHLRKRGAGKIMAIGSGAGHTAMRDTSSYAAAKAALNMLVRVTALEVAPFDISVNELIPGPVDTDMMRSGINRAALEALRDIEWVKQGEDLMPLALFLATQPDHGPTAQSFSLMRRP